MATDFTEQTAADAVVDSFAKTQDPRLRELLTYAECADVMRQALAGLACGEVLQPAPEH